MTAVYEAVAARADDSPGAVPAAYRTALVVTAGMVLLGGGGFHHQPARRRTHRAAQQRDISGPAETVDGAGGEPSGP
ncbi:hypothetical protein ADL27_49145 [Streptomyces sp. NRRL F-6602]|nr:hypothetical protein ADL27_49145 [Streptomyces sp. NRRL F-6602]